MPDYTVEVEHDTLVDDDLIDRVHDFLAVHAPALSTSATGRQSIILTINAATPAAAASTAETHLQAILHPIGTHVAVAEAS